VSDSATNNIALASLIGIRHQRFIVHMINTIINKIIFQKLPKNATTFIE
jgi:hypothetical protein